YAIRLHKTAAGDDYLLNFNVTGDLPKQRNAEKGEKPEEKEKRDKDFAAALKRMQDRIATEKALGKWTYIVSRSEIEPLLRSRADMLVKRGERPGFPPFGR